MPPVRDRGPYAPTLRERRIAGSLPAPPGAEVAFLERDGEVLWAAVTPVPFAPRSAVLELVIGAQEAFPGQAHAALRRRIFSSAAPAELDRAIVKVNGRKLCAGVVPEPGGEELRARDLGPSAAAARGGVPELDDVRDLDAVGAASSEAGLVRLAVGLAAQGQAAGLLSGRDRRVAALLVGSDGSVLAAARNTNGRVRALHAEVNLLWGWYARTGRGLPAGARVVTSLQCCRMCAALILRAAEDPDRIEVIYASPDPGRFGRDTALQRAGRERRGA